MMESAGLDVRVRDLLLIALPHHEGVGGGDGFHVRFALDAGVEPDDTGSRSPGLGLPSSAWATSGSCSRRTSRTPPVGCWAWELGWPPVISWRRSFPTFPEVTLRRILHDNAASLYGL